MEIGADEGSTVGDYTGPFGFTGLIDEVKVYQRALTAAEIEKHAAGADPVQAESGDLVLALSFDKAAATDASGNDNHGVVEGAVAAEGKIGKALKFTGASNRPPGYLVDHRWTTDLPLLPRAMVLAEETLFIAGPADLVDEEQAFREIEDPEVTSKLANQAAALEGKKGAVLWAVSVADGRKLAEHALDAPPVFDGMAAAGGRLYVSTQNGAIVCLAGE